MFETCLPISHLFDTPTPWRNRLWQDVDVLEFKTTRLPIGLPDKPVVFHWGLGTVQEAFIPEFDRLELGDFLKTVSARLFSFDLGPACRQNQHVLPLSPTLPLAELETITARALEHVRLGFNGPLAVENYNYYPTGLYEHICRPDVITRFLERHELGLVLDLAHAAVSAANLKLDLNAYLSEFSLDRIVEIHLSRPYFHKSRTDDLSAGIPAIDAHLPPREDDFKFLEKFLKRFPTIGTILVTIEHYDNLDSLARSYEHLSAIIERLNNRPNDAV